MTVADLRKARKVLAASGVPPMKDGYYYVYAPLDLYPRKIRKILRKKIRELNLETLRKARESFAAKTVRIKKNAKYRVYKGPHCLKKMLDALKRAEPSAG